MRLYNIRQAQISADNVYKVGVKTDDERVYPDGTREAVELGRQCEAEPGEVVRLEQRLPDDLKPTWFCMRASQQDMYVYVDGELRKDYSTKNTRLFGKNSASAYVFFEIKEEDAGSMLAVEIISESEYAGYLNEMYKGDKLDIAKVLVQECFGVLIISILMLMISFSIIVMGGVLHIVYKKKIPLTYLGIGICQLSMTMLIPYPFLAYINMVQKNRYARVYNILSVSVALNLVVSTILHVVAIVDFSDSTLNAYGLIVLMVLTIAITIIIDLVRGHRADYGMLLGGFIIMIVVALIETYVTFVPAAKLNRGFSLSVGLIILLALATCETAKDILELELSRKNLAVRLDEKVKEASTLQNISRQDTLTGLWNRAYTEETVSELLKQGEGSALFMMDLDNFKSINDQYGHIAGDACLKAFAAIICENVKERGIVCRIGGDEFLVFITSKESRQNLEICAASIIAQMCAYFESESFNTHSSVSVGIAEVPSDGNDFDSLYRLSFC